MVKYRMQLTTTASASGQFDPRYDKFNYALNTTQCPNGTLCPFSNNQSCCNKNLGIKEVHYNYTSSAVMPAELSELTTFYAAAGYTFPTSIPSLSTPSTGLSPSTEVYAAATPTPTPTATLVPGSSGTRQSVKTGLGVGITLSVLVCGVCAILLHLTVRRRRRRQQDDIQKDPTLPTPTLAKEHQTELEGTPGRLELEALKEVYELHVDSTRSLRKQS